MKRKRSSQSCGDRRQLGFSGFLHPLFSFKGYNNPLQGLTPYEDFHVPLACSSHNSPMRWARQIQFSLLTNRETDLYRGEVICPWSPSKWVALLRELRCPALELSSDLPPCCRARRHLCPLRMGSAGYKCSAELGFSTFESKKGTQNLPQQAVEAMRLRKHIKQ